MKAAWLQGWIVRVRYSRAWVIGISESKRKSETEICRFLKTLHA